MLKRGLPYVLPVVVAAAVFLLAYDDGTYGLQGRSVAAIAIWWTVIVGVGFGVLPLARVPRAAMVTGGFLTAFMGWTLLSTAWSPGPEHAFLEFNRVAIYLGVFVLAVLAGTRANVDRWQDALATGIALTAAVALLSRLFPQMFSARDLPAFLPSAQTRLSFPLGYWNGLAIFVALALPLLLRTATVTRRVGAQALAVGTIPLLAAVVYLASSRGGVLTAGAGLVVFLALTSERWVAAGAALAGLAGSAVVAIGVLNPRDALVNGPLDSSLAESQGRTAALLIVLVCVVTGAAFAGARYALRDRARPAPIVGRVLTAALVLVALVAFVAAHPAARFRDFKTSPEQLAIANQDFVRAHLLSGNGSGRWQFWQAAADQFDAHVLIGQGAGSYEQWWAEHGSISYFVVNAHSLYLEVMGELGIVGLLLLVAIFASAIFFAAKRWDLAKGTDRATVAALVAVVVAFLAGATVDWIWQLTVIGIVCFVSLGLLVGPGTVPIFRPRLAASGEAPAWFPRRFGFGAAVIVVGWLLISAQAVPLLSDLKLRQSQGAVTRGDGGAALQDALSARNIQPWSSSPYIQLALVTERAGRLEAAREWSQRAIEHDPHDWRLWLVLARVEIKAGHPRVGRAALRRAAALNPRSPLFKGLVL